MASQGSSRAINISIPHPSFNSPIARLIGKRLLFAVPTLIGATFLTFSLMNLLPGTAANALLPANATRAEILAEEVKLGDTRPFIPRYFEWLWHAVHGNLGVSLFSHLTAVSIIAQRFPVTAELVVLAFVLSLAIAFPVAALAARRPGGVADRVSTLINMAGLSLPVFVLGLLLILVFAVELRVLPSEGFVPISAGIGPNLRGMILPAVTIAMPLFCHYTRILRADLIDVMNSSDYIVTARAKGLPPRRILIRHAMRNSMFSVLTLIGLNLGQLIAGTVVVEQTFSLPGIGQELIAAVTTQDVEVVEAVVLVLAVTVIVVNLLTDVLIALIDPRIRYGGQDAR